LFSVGLVRALGVAMPTVFFEIVCRNTKPGELLFVVGSDEALGKWDPTKAVRMTTTAQKFPHWISAPVLVQADVDVDFKFLLRSEVQATAPAVWESFPGNRTLRAPEG